MSVDLLSNCIKRCPAQAVLMGLDVGKKTIGVAICDPGQGLATPICTIKRTKFTRDLEEIKRLAAEYEACGYVIGLPVNMDDGSEGPRAQSVRDFALEMDKQLGGQRWIALWDERLSTVSVEGFVDELVDKRKTKIKAKESGLIDKLAAQVILQGALDYISAARP